MDTLRSAGHLQRELGDELFEALVSSDNTAAVREFAAKLAGILPTAMTIGNRSYDILAILREGDGKSVLGTAMVERAIEMSAHNGKGECCHLLEYQAEIPVALRGKVAFIFTDYRHPDDPEDVAYVDWSGDRWVQCWYWLDSDFHGICRVLRRKFAKP